MTIPTLGVRAVEASPCGEAQGGPLPTTLSPARALS
jgi:hypothetical protein